MEHNNENNSSGQQAPRMVNNFQGAVIQNMVINNGTLTQHIGGTAQQTATYTDAQVARALMAVVGEGMPIDAKHKWAGAYWWLRWDANFPVDTNRFCERVKQLPGADELAVACDYENIRKVCTLTFMNYDPRQMDSVRVSTDDREEYACCREVALALAGALAREKSAKMAPPK
jgi:hypothetical protein